MKKTFPILLLLFGLFASAQKKEDQFFLFDKNWKPVEIKQAAYFIRVSQLNDSDYEWIYYNMYGPRIKQENYKDATAKIRNGTFTYYFDNGRIDSVGQYENNLRNGDWYYKNTDGRILELKHYNQDALTKDTVYGVQAKAKAKADIQPGEKESEYPGGLAGWQKYLNKNLHYPERATRANIEGDAEISFIVDEKGNIYSIELNRSVEFSIDEEGLRIIRQSNTWIPASKNGKAVKSYKIQPVRFRLLAN